MYVVIFSVFYTSYVDAFLAAFGSVAPVKLSFWFSGNYLGEDGCRALKDALEGMNMGELLGSLR